MARRRSEPKVPNTGSGAAKELSKEEAFRQEMYDKARKDIWKGLGSSPGRTSYPVRPRNSPNAQSREEELANSLVYAPTSTINPDRPRTLAASYNPATQTLRITFREGAVYAYYGIPWDIWEGFQSTASPGKYINATLNQYEYAQES